MARGTGHGKRNRTHQKIFCKFFLKNVLIRIGVLRGQLHTCINNLILGTLFCFFLSVTVLAFCRFTVQEHDFQFTDAATCNKYFLN